MEINLHASRRSCDALSLFKSIAASPACPKLKVLGHIFFYLLRCFSCKSKENQHPLTFVINLSRQRKFYLRYRAVDLYSAVTRRVSTRTPVSRQFAEGRWFRRPSHNNALTQMGQTNRFLHHFTSVQHLYNGRRSLIWFCFSTFITRYVIKS